MGIGKIVGTVFKGVGWISNEIFKEATGIDIKETMSPLTESYKKSNNISKKIKEFEKNKDAFIRDYGEDEYYSELEYLRDIQQVTGEDFQDSFNKMPDHLQNQLDQRKSKYEDMAMEKIVNMSDKQILYLLNKKELSSSMYKLLEQERMTRGI